MNNVEQLLQQILESQNETNKHLDSIDKKLNAINEQTANLTEFRTETNTKLDNISGKINAIEAVTKENLYDIAKLKLIK